MQYRTLIASALTVTAVASPGCARLGPEPRASIRPWDIATLAGTWRGTIGGRETTTAAGISRTSAQLTIRPDGTFTLVERGPGADLTSSGRITRDGDRILLSGTATAPALRAGEPVRHVLERRGDALYGQAETLHGGLAVKGDIELKRAL